MKRFVLIATLLVALAGAGSAAGSVKPAITVPRLAPIVVKGTGFKAGEHVKVIVRIPTAYRKTVVASSGGRFRVVFRIAAGKCLAIRALATGNKGSRATAFVPPSCQI